MHWDFLLSGPTHWAEYVMLAGAGVFDRAWYKENYRLAVGDADPLVHYLLSGESAGLRPNAWFDPGAYAGASNSRSSALAQFVRKLRLAGLDPRDRNDVMRFLSALRESPAPHRPANTLRPRDEGSDTPVQVVDAHAANRESTGGLKALPTAARHAALVANSGLFDLDWYRTQYLDASEEVDPIEHYLTVGAALGNDPSPTFSTAGYSRRYSDAKLSRANPLVHYLNFGRAEGRLTHAAEQETNELLDGLVRLGSPEYGPIVDLLRYDPVDADASATARDLSVCVHVHIYYDELLDAFAEALARFPFPLTLLVSYSSRSDPETLRGALEPNLQMGSRIVVQKVPNRGRDVAPWLVTFQAEILQHDLFCHLHTKRSRHSTAGSRWFDFLMHATCGSTQVISDIVELFRSVDDLGLVIPPYPGILPGQPNWGANRDHVESLALVLGFGVPPEQCPPYPAGSFFWARPKALEPLLSMGLNYEDFDIEAGQVDGTMAHVMERLLGWIPLQLGWQVRCATVDVGSNLTSYFGVHRPFAPSQLPMAAPAVISCRPALRVAVYTNQPQASAEVRLAKSAGTAGTEITGLPPDIGDERTLPAGIAPYRYFKTHPHRYFGNHEVAIWIDNHVDYLGDFQDLAHDFADSGGDVGFALHPARRSFIEEANEIINCRLDEPATVLRQVARYLRVPQAREVPVFDTSFFMCRPGSDAVRVFMEAWWSEVESFSFRDQLSAAVTVLCTGVRWTPILCGRSPLTHPMFFVSGPDQPEAAVIRPAVHSRFAIG